MFLNEVYTRITSKDCVGSCDESRVMSYVNEGVIALQNRARWDATIGCVDICACNGCVTLPRRVGTVLAVQVNGAPSYLRDQWYQFHLNGPGAENYTDLGYSTEDGEHPTFRDPSEPVYLVADVESAADNNKKLRVFGWDASGKRIFTEENGVLVDGFLVPTIFGFAIRNVNAPAIANIDHISKDVTNGFVKLLAVNTSGTTVHTLIGYYEPDETDPRYRRLKVVDQAWVRVKFKRKQNQIRSINDWINLDNTQALILAVKSVRLRYEGKYDEATRAETEATRLLSEEQESLRPEGAASGPQIINSDKWSTAGMASDRLFY